MKNQLPPLAYIVLHCEIGVEVSLAIVYPIRNTRAPWSYPPTTGNGIFLLHRRIHLCLRKLLETKNTLPSLIVLPLNMESAVGKILLRLPTGSTRILPPYPRRSDGIFSGFLIFKMKPSGNARNVSIIRTVKNSISVGIRLVIPYAGNAAPSAAPCIVRTLP